MATNSQIIQGQIDAAEQRLAAAKGNVFAWLYQDQIKAEEANIAQLKMSLNNAKADEAAQQQKSEGEKQSAQATAQANALAQQASISPEEQMRSQYAAAQDIAQKEAQKSSDYAIQQQIKAGRTSGMSQGASALQAMQGAGQQYQAARADELARSRGYYSDALQRQMQGRMSAGGLYQGNAGQQFSLYDSAQNRQAQAAYQQAQMNFQREQAQAQAQAQAQQNLLGGAVTAGGYLLGGPVGGAIAGGLSKLFGTTPTTSTGQQTSDRNAKDNIKQNSLSDSLNKIKSYSYKYKGSDRQENGVMAQDLEKGAMKSAVMDTPEGKVIDTDRLSTMNTGALADHEKQIRSLKDEVQTLIKELEAIPAPKGNK